MERLKIFICIFTFLAVKVNGEGCVSRNYGASSTVCVCTEDNCDYLEPYSEDSISGGSYLLYTTSRDGLRLSSSSATSASTVKKADAVTLQVDKSTTYQEIIGFGGALTDSAGYNIMDMSDSLQEHLYRTLFGEGGAHYNLLRLPLGGSDFSRSSYTYDDGDTEDINLEHFSLQREDTEIKIPIIKRANEVNVGDPIKLFTAPWYAPRWMREDPSSQTYTMNSKYYDTWANYFLKYFDAYAEQGVTFWGLTPQNEPSQIYFVQFTPEEYADWTGNHLIPALQNSDYRDITLMLVDDNRNNFPGWFETALQNENIKSFAKGSAVHWYADGGVNPNVLTQTHDLDPSKFILYTESCELRAITPDHLGDWSIAEEYGTRMLEVVNYWATGWVEWNMILDTNGGGSEGGNRFNAPIIFNLTAQEFYKQPIFYIQSHFSMFLPPGSKHIELKSDGSSLQSSAFITPDNVVTILIMNKQDDAVSAIINDPEHGDISIDIQPRSFNTLIYK